MQRQLDSTPLIFLTNNLWMSLCCTSIYVAYTYNVAYTYTDIIFCTYIDKYCYYNKLTIYNKLSIYLYIICEYTVPDHRIS